MKKRSIAFLLSLVMLLSLLTPTALAEEPEQEGQVTEESTEIPALSAAEVSVPREAAPDQVITVAAEAGAESWQWQFQLMEDLWVNISGDESAEIVLTYAKVCNMLDENGQARLRCLVDGAASETLTVTVTDGIPETQPAQEPGAPVVAEEPDETPVADETPAEDETPALDAVQGAEDTIVGLSNGAVGAAEEQEETGEPETSTFTITINYVFKTSKQEAATPWTATIAKGSSFKQSIASPAVTGYAPDQASVDVDVTDIQEDVTYTVKYSPAQVKFTVRHMLQNVDDDDYTQAAVEQRDGYTESPVGEGLAQDYTGFTALLYDTTTKIAADGSTVVEIKYDRNYYLMLFALDGGYGVEPIYARYGAEIGNVGTPVKSGYDFKGWAEGALPATMPAKKTIYTAIWQPGNTAKVTVVIWGENADDEDYSYMGSQEINGTPGTTVNLDGYTCNQEEHTHSNACGISCNHVHTAGCYGATRQEDPVDSKTGSADANVNQFKALTGNQLENGKIYRVKCDGAATTQSYDKYYLYFDNTWYSVNSNAVSGSAIKTSGKVNAHGHSWNMNNNKDRFWVYNAKLSCTHTHIDACYECGMTEHQHNANCRFNPELDSKLWVRNDEKSEINKKSVAADGSTIINVYYDRTEFTLTFRDGSKTVATIKDKWGAAISDEFSKAPFNTTYNGRAWLCTDDEKYSYALQTLDRMPQFDATFNLYTKSSNTKKTIYYYVQKVGTTVRADQWPTSNSNFNLMKQVDTYFNFATYDEEYHEILGFTRYSAITAGFRDNEKYFNNYRLNLYYMRNSYKLVFNNGYEDIRTESEQYEAPLSKYKDYVPPLPTDHYEEGGYEFGGWYFDPKGERACDLDTYTMPAGTENGGLALILYAHWVPVTHTVTTYLTEDAVEKNPPLKTESVEHNKFATAPTDVDNGNYEFVGWFYQDNGVEKAFDFENMPVKKDLTIYGKWRANSMVDFVIHYQLEDGTPVAEDRVGKALAESTQTFDAKIGNDLYQGYREGYFPEVASHSMFMNIAGKNEYTFVYVELPSVNYTVKYLEKGTNRELLKDKDASTSSAVITERFERIPGYRPDAYQKRLVLSADESENVLIFYYTKDNEHADVTETHYIQNLDGSYSVYQSTTNLNGVINDTYKANVLDIPGFRFEKSTVNGTDQTPTDGKLTATLTQEGLTFEFYYVRNEYPYTFKFLEQGTEKVLAPEVTGTELYGKDVTHNSLNIPGYTCVSGNVLRITIDVDNNEAIFYYTEQEVTINYVAVGPDGKQFGSVAPGSEKVKVLTGTPGGSAPTAEDGFRFVGWFKDADCKQPVDEDWVVSNKLTPGKTKNYGTESEPKMGYEAATYYAKFEYDVADLTITKTGCANIDENQSFIFTVTGEGLPTEGLKVVVEGNGSVTITGLKVGTTYTITEETGWSWRYTPKNANNNVELTQSIALQAEVNGHKNIVTFNNDRTEPKWLNGCSIEVNNWKKKSDEESSKTN